MWTKFRHSEIRNSTKLSQSIIACFAHLCNFSQTQPVFISIFADEEQEIGKKPQKSFNVNEEYLCTLRTKSFSEFFTKAEFIVDESPPSITSSSAAADRCRKLSETILLQPVRLEAVPSILESSFLLMLPELKGLFIDYLNVSAKASNLCTRLLTNVKSTRSKSRCIQQSLDSIEKCFSSETIESIASDLLSLRAPFSDLDKRDFTLIHADYTAISRRLNCTRKKVERKIRTIKIIDGITCGLNSITTRTLTDSVMAKDPGPVIFGYRLKSLGRKLVRHEMLRNGGLEKVGEKVEAAAKGSYIMKRELDTTSRLVVRLGDAVDHGKAMLRLFGGRKEDKFAVSVAMDEVKKNNVSMRKQVEDVEEHLYLCIVTINRSRASVIKQL
ncbi:UPF0496 protein At3g49070-like [Benincasa hispida]|uniref:UPF0496 protein At3g49070-like n=1 Tax=Benincasa hispida TaxID=102211 RepID=UPI0018FF5EFC|nr:UPF0496 protein At3g49070-like [Benincasa hispida]